MKRKILIDINVVLDVLQKRGKDFYGSSQVLSLCADGKVTGYLSAASFGILHYILAKSIGNTSAMTTLKKIKSFLKVAAIDEAVIDSALESEFKDFEDALQYCSASQSGLTHIITRNKKDFVKADIAVLLPEEFLTLITQ